MLVLYLLAALPLATSKVAISAVNHLTDPCQFPLPSSPYFSPLCQFDYHGIPWLCDPSGLLSRTEAEILDTGLQKVSNVSNCYCHSERCYHDDTIKLSILLIPYGSVASIDSCVSASPFATGLGLPSTKTYTFASAALAYAREVARRWSGQCFADVKIVYIQSWQPEHSRKPFVVRLFQNKFAEYATQPFVQTVSREASAFETLNGLLNETLRFVNSQQRPRERSIRHKTQTSSNSFVQYFESWGAVGGVPLWAFALGSGLLLLVVIAVYIANIVTERLAVQKQMLKKQSISASKYNNERWRSTGPTHYSPIPGTTTATGQRIVKSTMMFRQFSGDRKSKNVNLGQKI